MIQRSKPTTRRLGAAALSLALVLAACGGDDDDSTPEATDPPEETDAPTDTTPATDPPVATDPPDDTEPDDGDTATTQPTATTAPEATGDDLDALVNALLERDLEFNRPEEPVDPGTHEVAVVAAGLASSGPATVASELARAFEVMGWTAPDAYDGKFTPTEQSALIQKAVQDGADAIFMIAITPDAVAAGVSSAVDAGIPLICMLCGPNIPEGMTSVEIDAAGAGRGQAEFAIANSDDDATIFVYQNEEFASSTLQSAAAAERVRELCPGCTVETPSLLLAEARTAGAPVWQSLLNDHGEGELDWVILPFDSPSAALAQSAQQLGRDDFGIIGYGALSPFVDMVGAGDPPTAIASLTIPTPYVAWSGADQAARLLAGVETWDSAGLPVGLITADNFSTYPEGLPYVYPDFDYEAEFAELWGK